MDACGYVDVYCMHVSALCDCPGRPVQCGVLFLQVVQSAGLPTQVLVQGGGEADSQEVACSRAGQGSGRGHGKIIKAQK